MFHGLPVSCRISALVWAALAVAALTYFLR
jgi:hypothetical protein